MLVQELEGSEALACFGLSSLLRLTSEDCLDLSSSAAEMASAPLQAETGMASEELLTAVEEVWERALASRTPSMSQD